MTKTKPNAKGFESTYVDRGGDTYPDKCDPFVKIVGEKAIKSETMRHFDMDRQGDSISFTIQAANHQYIILHATTMELELEFRRLDGSVITEAEANAQGEEEVYCTNLPGASLFKSVTISVRGEEQPSLSTNHYGYKAMLQHYQSYGNNLMGLTQSTLLPRHFFVENSEDVELRERTIAKTDANGQAIVPAATYKSVSTTNLEKRKKLFHPLHKPWTVVTPVYADLFQAGKVQSLWPSAFRPTATFELQRPAFYLLCQKDRGEQKGYYIHIRRATLNVKYVELFPEVQERFLKEFRSGGKLNVFFPRTTLVSYNVNKNTTQVMKSNIYEGILPAQIIICMVSTESTLGKYHKNPYYLHHYNLKNIEVTVNGVNKIPSNLHWSFAKKEYLTLYNFFLENSKRGTCDRSDMAHQITYEKFANGFFYLPIDVGPTLCLDKHNHIPAHLYGDLGVRLEFETPLTEEITLQIFGLFHSNVELSIYDDLSHQIQVLVPLDRTSLDD